GDSSASLPFSAGRGAQAQAGGEAHAASRRRHAVAGRAALGRDDFSSNRHPALAFWWSMIFFRKPVPTPDQVRGRLFRDHALVNSTRHVSVMSRSAWVATFLLFPLPSSRPKRNSVRPGPTLAAYSRTASTAARFGSAGLRRDGRARRA